MVTQKGACGLVMYVYQQAARSEAWLVARAAWAATPRIGTPPDNCFEDISTSPDTFFSCAHVPAGQMVQYLGS